MHAKAVRTNKTVGFMATGNEITCGDLQNTNTTQMAHLLEESGITVGQHLAVADCINQMSQALRYLWDLHDAIIISGGLGPTCDDCTRQAVAMALDLPLTFDDESWNKINEMFIKKNIALTDNNRQQAQFPQGATVITNHKGSANGCMIEKSGKLVFLLPGPPHECLAMFEQEVKPQLLARHFSHQMKRFNSPFL